MGKYIFRIEGEEYSVDVKSITGDTAVIEIDGKTVSVNIKQLGIKEPSVSKKRKTDQSSLRVGEGDLERVAEKSKKTAVVKAPIPGIVLKILVDEGDLVKAGQDILLMEAMKMENQIQATSAGVIKKIHVRRDDAVQQDDILMEIEPS